jgi:hypothetical protein
MLASLEHAFLIDETIRVKLNLLARKEKTDAGLQKEIEDLANQLETAVDRTETARAEALFDDFKKEFIRAAARK